MARPPLPDGILEGTETVLLIDDEDLIVDVGRELMEAIGYRVITTKSGGEAIRIYERRASEIDIVILDMVMPEMGGDEVFHALRAVNPEVRVILSSGYSIDGKASDLLAQGCRGFIQKPFSLAALSQKLREVLA